MDPTFYQNPASLAINVYCLTLTDGHCKVAMTICWTNVKSAAGYPFHMRTFSFTMRYPSSQLSLTLLGYLISYYLLWLSLSVKGVDAR